MSYLPPNDTFGESSPVYGSKLTSWIRNRPWTTDAATGYAIPTAVGTLHSGYFAPISGSTSRWRRHSKPASFTSPAVTVAPLCVAMCRSYFAVRTMPVLCFSLRLLEGNYNDSFRYAYIAVRNTGGTVDDTNGSEHIHSSSCYAFMLNNAAGAGGARYQLLRVNSGTITLLAQTAAFTLSAAQIMAPRSLGLMVDDSGGNVVLTPQVEFYEQVTPSSGLGAVNPFGASIVDSSGSKITSTGRVSFGLSMERAQSSPTIKTATLAHSFAIKDLTLDAWVFFDEWERVCLDGGSLVTGELHGKNGRSLHNMWLGEWGTLAGAHLLRDAGANRIKVTDSSVDFIAAYQKPATRDYFTQRKITSNFASSATSGASLAIVARGTALEDPARRIGYGLRLQMTAGGTPTFQLSLLCYDGANVNPLFRTLTLASTPTIAGLVTGSDISIELEIENQGGVDATLGFPRFIARVNNVAVTTWVAALDLPGIEVDGSEITDERPERILTGREEGLHIKTNPSTAGFKIDTWVDTQPSGADLGPDSQSSADVGSEVDGKTGTFVAPLANQEIRRVLPVEQNISESRHVQRVRLATRERRFIRGTMRAAKRTTEKDPLRAFVAAHQGAGIPFDYVDPRGVAMVGAFKKGKHKDSPVAPEVSSYEVEIEERIP